MKGREGGNDGKRETQREGKKKRTGKSGKRLKRKERLRNNTKKNLEDSDQGPREVEEKKKKRGWGERKERKV